MLLPQPRGPVSGHVIESLRRGSAAPGGVVARARQRHRRPGRPARALGALRAALPRLRRRAGDREWDAGLIEPARQPSSGASSGSCARRSEPRARGAVARRVTTSARRDLRPRRRRRRPVAGARSCSARPTREHVLDFLRERSLQQLKESDPQAFVLPRLTGRAKVALAELQYDEFGAGRPERLHQALYAEALDGRGARPHLRRLRRRGVGALAGVRQRDVAVRAQPTPARSSDGTLRRLRGDELGAVAQDRCRDRARSGFPPPWRRTSTSTWRPTPSTSRSPRGDICGALVAERAGPARRRAVRRGVLRPPRRPLRPRPAGALDAHGWTPARRRSREPSGPVRVRQVPGGPLLVRGADCVVDDDGEEHEVTRPVVAVCACGKSGRQPWCDSTHKAIPRGSSR